MFGTKKRSELCRICFIEKFSYLNIFETIINNRITIADLLVRNLGLNMYPEKNLPEIVCCDCMEELSQIEDFNVSCKTVLKDLVWRARLTKMDYILSHRKTTGMSYSPDSMKCLSEDIKYSENHTREISDDDFMPKAIQENWQLSYENKCKICTGLFLNLEDLYYHKHMFHEVNEGFPCGKCYRRFKTLRKLKRHIEKYSFTCKFQCSLIVKEKKGISIGKLSLKSEDLDSVSQGESMEKNRSVCETIVLYSCDKCKDSFMSRKLLNVHLQKIHSSIKPSMCRICKLGFISRKDLEFHRYIHPKDLKCDNCERQFSNPRCYKLHIEICQSKSVVFRCIICGKEFSSKENLKSHLRTHSSVKKFACHICNRKFSNSSNLIHHRNHVHPTVKPFKCEMCDKSFVKKYSLLLHHVCHSDEKPYECSICLKRFKRKVNVATHQRNIHNIVRNPKEHIIVEEYDLNRIVNSC